MESKVRSEKLSLIQVMQNNPMSFSFEMAAYILENQSPISFGKESNIKDAPFHTKSINSFHLRATEIDKISNEYDKKVIHVERLSLAGINAPLPTPYAELILRRKLESDDAMSEFLNIFNMRLLGISYQISKRRYLTLQKHNENSKLVKSIASLCGENPSTFDRRISKLAYLFWTQEKSAAGLEAIITCFFGLHTKVTECKSILFDRKNVIGLSEMKLGMNSELGRKVEMSSYGVDIEITHNDYDKLSRFISSESHQKDLKFLIRKYLGFTFTCTIKITPKSVPPLKMCNAILGKTSWMDGKIFDSAKIIC